MAGLVTALLHFGGTRLGAQTVILYDAFPHLSFTDPVDLQNAGDGTNRLFIVRQAGYIDVVENSPDATSSKVFLDIDSLVLSGGERGLLGLAFHPSYESNGYFFVDYTRDSPLRTVVSRFTVSAANPDTADPGSEVIFLEVQQPYANHNAGQLSFGPDGYLYIALGDGGSGGDPGNRAQDRTVLLGSILRIDVDSPADTFAYSIPPDNPYAGNTEGFREEIFAYGFRNPWRFSFDRLSGVPVAGDVGQNDWEEVDVLVKGNNYGWRLKEGLHCYLPTEGCDTLTGLTDPVWEYAHDTGGCSITGGYVYRGEDIPALHGKYIYGDYCSGRIWALDTNGAGVWQNIQVLDSSITLSSFGVDRRNEIYACSPGVDKIFRLITEYPPVPLLIDPADASVNVTLSADLLWSGAPSAIGYHLQVSEDMGFGGLVADDSSLTDTSYSFPGEPGGTTWFWRVRARNEAGWSPFSPAWWFTTDTLGTRHYDFSNGWNLVSLPLDVVENRRDSVFPTATSSVFAYTSGEGYAQRESLLAGVGYWVKFAGPQTLPIRGGVRETDTLPVLTGWNLVGTLTLPIPVDSIETDPLGLLLSRFFGYDGGYFPADTLDPARGYWVMASGPGTIVLRANGLPGGSP